MLSGKLRKESVMRKGLRNFKCPVTQQACADGRCTKDDLCCEREIIEIADRKQKGDIEADEFFKLHPEKRWRKYSPDYW
jgi:hypothetical protein